MQNLFSNVIIDFSEINQKNHFTMSGDSVIGTIFTLWGNHRDRIKLAGDNDQNILC